MPTRSGETTFRPVPVAPADSQAQQATTPGKVAQVFPQVSSNQEKIPQTGEGETAQTQGNDQLILRIPDTAIIPEGATFHEGDDDGKCRLIRADGARCRGARMRATGLCAGHSGTGLASDPALASTLAAKGRTERARRRMVLGISARGAAQPLALARMRAQMRAEDYAQAVVDAPLDDAELGSVARQQAAIRALELLYPQATLQASVELPADSDGVASMGWQDMQALAASLVTNGDQEA